MKRLQLFIIFLEILYIIFIAIAIRKPSLNDSRCKKTPFLFPDQSIITKGTDITKPNDRGAIRVTAVTTYSHEKIASGIPLSFGYSRPL